MNAELTNEIDRILAQYIGVHDELESLWLNQIVFRWHWWLDVALAVLPWIFWLIVRDRKKTFSLLCAGLFTMLVASLLDMIGVSQNGWKYNTLLLPYLTQYLPWDLTIMPVAAMLYYQLLPKVNPWIKGLAFGVTAAYIVEPIFVWLGVYEQNGWEHHYSLPIYFVIYMIGYWLYKRSLSEAEKHE